MSPGGGKIRRVLRTANHGFQVEMLDQLESRGRFQSEVSKDFWRGWGVVVVLGGLRLIFDGTTNCFFRLIEK